MRFEFMLLAERREHGHGDQASRLELQARPLPDIAPGFGGDVFLDRTGEIGGVGESIGYKIFAHHLLAGGEAFVELGFHGLCAPGQITSIAADSP